MIGDLSALSLEQKVAWIERHLMTLLGVVHGMHEALESEEADEHIDP